MTFLISYKLSINYYNNNSNNGKLPNKSIRLVYKTYLST